MHGAENLSEPPVRYAVGFHPIWAEAFWARLPGPIPCANWFRTPSAEASPPGRRADPSLAALVGEALEPSGGLRASFPAPAHWRERCAHWPLWPDPRRSHPRLLPAA